MGMWWKCRDRWPVYAAVLLWMHFIHPSIHPSFLPCLVRLCWLAGWLAQSWCDQLAIRDCFSFCFFIVYVSPLRSIPTYIVLVFFSSCPVQSCPTLSWLNLSNVNTQRPQLTPPHPIAPHGSINQSTNQSIPTYLPTYLSNQVIDRLTSITCHAKLTVFK